MSCYSQSHFDCSNLFTCSFTGFHSLQRLTAIVVIRNSHILYYRSLSKVTGVTRGLHWTTVTCVGIETPGGTEVNVCTGVINRQNMLGVCVYVLQFFSSVLPGNSEFITKSIMQTIWINTYLLTQISKNNFLLVSRALQITKYPSVPVYE